MSNVKHRQVRAEADAVPPGPRPKGDRVLPLAPPRHSPEPRKATTAPRLARLLREDRQSASRHRMLSRTLARKPDAPPPPRRRLGLPRPAAARPWRDAAPVRIAPAR